MRGLAYGFDRLLARVDQTVLVVIVWIAIGAILGFGLTVSFVLN